MSLPTRTLGSGSAALEVPAQGLGCMGMSFVYGTRDNEESTATLLRALELGVSFWDTADVYGPHHNEELIGEVLKTRRSQVTLATKFANHMVDGKMTITGDPQYVRQSCDDSLQRLGIDTIDLYYYHRVDRRVPIEDTWGAMAELVTAGKVRYLGISEASADVMRRAHAVHPMTAGQYEWSLFTRDIEHNEILSTARELGIGMVPYSPLGRGLLTGTIQSTDELVDSDWRRSNPRFQGQDMQANLKLVEQLSALAAARGVTPAQLALAWVQAQGSDVVPIPGTKRRKYLDDNVAAATIQLTSEELAAIDVIAPYGAAAGGRYAASAMPTVNP
ncbi:MAG: aldo/keto reductase [Actinomycetota bacterium]|nr:aldo/keto reductase [Actinomycetota bacterium]